MISLISSAEALRARLQKDVNMGLRTADVFLRSLTRVQLYEGLNTVKIDVSSLSPEWAAEMVIGL